ncbi:MAG TPA: flagellin [Trinickia sp.]|nr:flagellin [Trinickia sp.]
MLSINSNINSLTAQENLNGSQNALSQAITRLSSGKRINSAADDAAGLAISTSLQTQVNGLNQGVQNANDGTSIVQTASTGLSQITQSLQTIRQLAVEASSGSLSSSDQAALQQEVAQQVQEVNRIASQTTYNGVNLLNGSAGLMNFQVGANVGQSISINLTQGVSAATLGSGYVQAGNTLGTITGLSLNAAGTEAAAGTTPAITSINVLSNGNGGFTYTDQNNQTLGTATVAALFSTATANGITTLSLTAGTDLSSPTQALTDIHANYTTGLAAGTTLGTISNIAVNGQTGANVAAGSAGYASAVTSITVKSDGNGGYQFFDQNGNQLSATATSALFSVGAGTAGAPGTIAYNTVTPTTTTATTLANINSTNQPTTVANVNVSSTLGANQAIETIDNALATVNNIQATLGAAQNRFTGIAQSQQDESSDLSSAQSQITDADFAQETANLSKAQVLQQAGISVLAQANSLPQQVLKLLQ